MTYLLGLFTSWKAALAVGVVTFALGFLGATALCERNMANATAKAVAAQHAQDVKQHGEATKESTKATERHATETPKKEIVYRKIYIAAKGGCPLPSGVVELLNEAGH